MNILDFVQKGNGFWCLGLFLLVLVAGWLPVTPTYGSEYHKCHNPGHCQKSQQCTCCSRDVIGMCMNGKYLGRKCESEADVLLCIEGGGRCNLVPQSGDPTPQTIVVCNTVNGKCECECKALLPGPFAPLRVAACRLTMETTCKQTGACKCDGDGVCTYPNPCAGD